MSSSSPNVLRGIARRPCALLVVLMALMGARVAAAASRPDPVALGPWSGTVECTIDIETADFSRHETHTWTFTGEAPKINGVIVVWPARWSASGHGAVKKVQGSQTIASSWTFDVPARDAQLATFVRGSDQQLIFRQWGSRAHVNGARQVTTNGKPRPPANNPAVDELDLGWIADDRANASVSGSRAIDIEGLSADLSSPGAPHTATCTWRFTRVGGDADAVSERPPTPQTPAPAPVVIPVTPATPNPSATTPPPSRTTTEPPRPPASPPAVVPAPRTGAPEPAPARPPAAPPSAPGSDAPPPAAPTNLVASEIGASNFRLTWSPSTGDNGALSYEVLVTDARTGKVTIHADAVSPIDLVDVAPAHGTFKVQVRATDSAGNVSPRSAPLIITLLP